MKAPVRVTVTGAAGQIVPPSDASGSMLGDDQPVILQLDITGHGRFMASNGAG